MADRSDLIGTWRMTSWTRRAVVTGQLSDAIGPQPIGYVAYHADGRMMATVFHHDRPAATHAPRTTAEKAALFDTMLAYVASWSIDGDRVIHHVEAAWNPDWQVDLTRPFTLTGDRLSISGAPGVDPATGEKVVYAMEFTRVPPDE